MAKYGFFPPALFLCILLVSVTIGASQIARILCKSTFSLQIYVQSDHWSTFYIVRYGVVILVAKYDHTPQQNI